jgi:hypothetical protein
VGRIIDGSHAPFDAFLYLPDPDPAALTIDHVGYSHCYKELANEEDIPAYFTPRAAILAEENIGAATGCASRIAVSEFPGGARSLTCIDSQRFVPGNPISKGTPMRHEFTQLRNELK